MEAQTRGMMMMWKKGKYKPAVNMRGRGKYGVLMMLVGVLELYSPGSFAIVQQATTATVSQSMSSVGGATLTPGGAAANVATFTAYVSGQYPSETVTCLSGCTDGTQIFVALSDQWSQGGASCR